MGSRIELLVSYTHCWRDSIHNEMNNGGVYKHTLCGSFPGGDIKYLRAGIVPSLLIATSSRDPP